MFRGAGDAVKQTTARRVNHKDECRGGMGSLLPIAHSGAVWAGVLLLAALGNLPWLAHVAPYKCSLSTCIGRTLDAVYTTRRANRAGEKTLLVAGNSVVMGMKPGLLLPNGHPVIAMQLGLVLGPHLTYAQWLTDVAPADIMLVPLTWRGFSTAKHDVPAERPGGGAWSRVQHSGVGRTLGQPRQLVRLTEIQFSRIAWPRPARVAVSQVPREGLEGSLAIIGAGTWAISLLRERTVTPQDAKCLQALQAHGAERGVRVLYYLTPQNPYYTRQWPAEWAAFHEALSPHLFLDLSSLLPEDEFQIQRGAVDVPDPHHFRRRAGPRVSGALGNALRRRRPHWEPLPVGAAAPTLAERFHYAMVCLQADARRVLEYVRARTARFTTDSTTPSGRVLGLRARPTRMGRAAAGDVDTSGEGGRSPGATPHSAVASGLCGTPAFSPVAQLVERVAVNHLVAGSSPAQGARSICCTRRRGVRRGRAGRE